MNIRFQNTASAAKRVQIYILISIQQHKNQQILKLICTNIDIIVFIKNKAVHEVIEVIGSEKQNPIYNQLYLEDQGFSLSSPLPYVC